MQILYISSEYPPETGFGGIGTYTKHVAEGMALRGNTVHVLSRSLNEVNSVALVNGVTVHRISSGNYNLPKGKIFFPFRQFCYRMLPHTLVRLCWARAVAKVVKELQNEGNSFDIIEYPECGGEGYYLKRSPGVRIAKLHTPWYMISEINRIREAPGDRILLTYIEKRSVGSAHLVTSPSQALADIIRKRWKLPRIEVIHNPLPSGEYHQTSGGGWIYTGRVEMRKGVHILLEAYSEICRTHPAPPPLKIIGRAYGVMSDGTDYGEHIRAKIREAPLKGNVEWIEGLPLEDVKKNLLSSSVAIFPSIWENFPYAALEAMACGLAVVASDCGGYPEMLQHGKSGLLVTPESPMELKAALEKLLENPEMICELGKAARVRVSTHFDTRLICEEVHNIYEKAVRKK